MVTRSPESSHLTCGDASQRADGRSCCASDTGLACQVVRGRRYCFQLRPCSELPSWNGPADDQPVRPVPDPMSRISGDEYGSPGAGWEDSAFDSLSRVGDW